MFDLLFRIFGASSVLALIGYVFGAGFSAINELIKEYYK